MPPELVLPSWLPFEDISYLAIFVLLFLEGLGLPFTPVELVAGLSGYLAATGDLKFLPACLSGIAGNLVGSLVSYLIGFAAGRPFLKKFGKFIFVTPERLERAERLREDLGPAIVLVYRFIPGLRHVGGFVLGVIKLPLAIYILLSLISITAWNILFMVLGFYFGATFSEHAIWIVPLFILIIAGGLMLTAVIRYRKSTHKH